MLVQSAVIIDAARSPMAAAEAGGSFSDSSAENLLTQLLDGLIRRSGFDPDAVDDAVITFDGGDCEWVGAVTRDAWENAGHPNPFPPATAPITGADSSNSIYRAMQRACSGNGHIVIGGGTDCSPAITIMDEPGQLLEMVAAEALAAEYKLTRQQLDDYAARSHRRAAAVAAAGEFKDEIVPISMQTPQGRRVISADTTTDSGVTADSLATLPPLAKHLGLSERFPNIHWRITEGNSAQPAAGASAVLIANERRAQELQSSPRARVHAVSAPVGGHEPAARLARHVQVTRAALQQLDIDIDRIDHFEICEASAVIPLAWQAALDINPAVLNPRGGAISLGHPCGASTARMLTTMLGALEATGGRYGLQIQAVNTRMPTILIVENLRLPSRRSRPYPGGMNTGW